MTVDAGCDAAAQLRTTAAIRERSGVLLARARAGESRWFLVDDAAIGAAADAVATLTRNRFPTLDIPYHSRWRHFEAGGIDRAADLHGLLEVDAAERARIDVDLTVVSVLLDAGAGPDWAFVEHRDGREIRYTRSEGLGVASWHAFVAGTFSGDVERPLRADAAGLCALTEPRLAPALQVSPGNPLVGLDGRVQLLQRLGETLAAQPEVFGSQARPGGMVDVLVGNGGPVDAHDILTLVLTSLSPIWPSRNRIGDESLGDCWRHEALDGPGLTAGWVPLHKLSQWLTYSLIEPFERAGVDVVGVERLTGLPEYRNGGLLLDTGVLRLRDAADADRTWEAGDELVVEWRALTVALLDELAAAVRERLEVSEERMPLARVLEGGTWAAGRESAQRLRGGLPPLSVRSDGTLF